MQKMKILLVPLLVLITVGVSGCASSIMQSYIGQPVQNVMLDYGPPVNAFDMPDGQRVFQWSQQSSYTIPTTVRTTSSGTALNNGAFTNAWVTSNSVITGGQTVTDNCIYSLFAEWRKKEKTYYITGYKKPNIMCE